MAYIDKALSGRASLSATTLANVLLPSPKTEAQTVDGLTD